MTSTETQRKTMTSKLLELELENNGNERRLIEVEVDWEVLGMSRVSSGLGT